MARTRRARGTTSALRLVLVVEGITQACGDHAAARDVWPPEQIAAWSGSELTLESSVPERWSQLRGPIGTVCITGDDRIGKSTLLSLWGRMLARDGLPFSFEAGHTLRSHTKGLWSAHLPRQVIGRRYHLNLCDSQGTKQGTELEQWRLFSANVLLPSVLIYMVRDVIQNDQVRDLAGMARQFQVLSAEQMGRFGRALSPHLVVMVREDSALEARNLSAHFEEVLATPGFEVAKELIQSVFRTREVCKLANLPLEAQLTLRDGDPDTAEGIGGERASAWRASADVALGRVLAALDDRLPSLPEGGLELMEWYRSVLQTVNSQDEASMGRLVDHGERLAAWHFQRRILREWRSAVLIAVCAIALLAFGGCLGRWLDRAAWASWVAICVCYAGTSPLVTTPLAGLVPRYCERFAGLENAFIRSACREVSSSTMAVLIAVALGVFTYPMLAVQLRWLFHRLPLPGTLRRLGGAMGTLLVVCCLGLLQEEDLSATVGPRRTRGPLEALAAALAVSCIQLSLEMRGNRLRKSASEEGRDLHRYVAARFHEVQELEASREWAAYYRTQSKLEAIWQCRGSPTWRRTALCLQACALMGWAWLIHPHCDILLTVGALGNVLNLAWALYRAALRCTRSRKADPVEEWFHGLQDADSDEDLAANDGGPAPEAVETAPGDAAAGSSAEDVGASATDPGARRRGGAAVQKRRRVSSPSPPSHAPVLAETEEELHQRLAIESMRRRSIAQVLG